MTIKLQIEPNFQGADRGDGGIRRVSDAQKKYLPELGIEIVRDGSADMYALHAGNHVSTDKPIVVHCHGLYWKGLQWPNWHYRLNREVAENIKMANKVTAPSEWVANAIRRAFNINPVIIPHGVEPMPVSAPNGDGYVLWSKARQDIVCDPHIVTQLARNAPDVQFVSTFGFDAENVKIVGRQTYESALELMLGASIYLSTTKETFGIGTLEAMASGVPVLGWNFGGNVGLVIHGESGYLAEFGDYDDLLSGLRFCIKNRDRLGAEGRRIATKHYNWPTIMKKYVEVYETTERYDTKVSIVIPCYNLGKYLERAVESVIGQSHEIIIVDDASTDDTFSIAQRLAETHEKVSVIKHEENQHVAAARNTGVDASTHGFILALDADDRMAPGSIKLLQDALINDRTKDISYGACQFLDDEHDAPVLSIGENGVSRWPPEFKYDGLHKYPFSYCPASSLFRREVYDRTDGYRTRYKGVEDADFYTRAISLGFRPVKATEAITLQHTIRLGSLSTQDSAKKDWTLWFPVHGSVPPEGLVAIPSCDEVKISVVIPVGPGHEKYVINALDSLIMQDFYDWECIVVNDSGGDLKLPTWVKEYDSAVYKNDRKGPGYSRNIGILAAKAKLIYFLDADDHLIHQSALGTMYKTWQENGGGFVYTDWVDDKGGLHTTTGNVCADALGTLPTPVNILFEKSSGVRFDTNMIGWEEWDFVLQLLEKGFCGHRISYPMFKYYTQYGTVRKSTHERYDEVSGYLRDKWGAYIRGEKELACGSCGASRTVTYAFQSSDQEVSHIGQSLMEYVGDNPPKTYRGPATGALYRFGVPTHTIAYVDDRDIEGLLNITGFQVYVAA